MVSAKQGLKTFIDNIPDAKLAGFSNQPGTTYDDQNYRLDMQGITSNDEWNLQIQANKNAKITSVKKIAPKTVAGPVLVSRKSPLTAAGVRQAFKDKILV